MKKNQTEKIIERKLSIIYNGISYPKWLWNLKNGEYLISDIVKYSNKSKQTVSEILSYYLKLNGVDKKLIDNGKNFKTVIYPWQHEYLYTNVKDKK